MMTQLESDSSLFASPLSVDYREQLLLAPYAMFSKDSAGRRYPEPPHAYRGPYERDRDRILHSAAYRRLSGKTQVFTGRMGDYHRTRLTHTQEVATIARTVARSLRLNEDLVEGLALIHDLGHPPFGHAGEDTLNECAKDHGGFSHNQYALVLVEQLEQRYTTYPGLNLSAEVLAGQLARIDKHHQGPGRLLEVQLVDAADSMTYDAHDTDDAIKLNLVSIDQMRKVPLIGECVKFAEGEFTGLPPKQLRRALVHRLIELQVTDLIEHNRRQLEQQPSLCRADIVDSNFRLRPSAEIAGQKQELEAFLYQHVYRHPTIMAGRREAQLRLTQMFEGFLAKPDLMPMKFQNRISDAGVHRVVVEYLAGMTDRYCDDLYQKHFSS